MNRIDSGFIESCPSKAFKEQQTPVHRSNTAPTRRRKPRTAPTDSISSSQPIVMEPQRPASERRSKPSRQKSTTSSSENSTSRSKGRGHGSKPSSHRTSCTIVDPSRPARHYRMRSSQTVPTANNQDIDDVLALHFRSCSLFTNPSYHTNPGLPSPTLTQGENMSSPNTASRFNSIDINVAEDHALPKQSEETIAAFGLSNTTTHWTSPTTRKRDYERIDKANSGLRGFVRKIMPRCVSGPQEKFYEKDQSDAGSVRRYRMDHVAHHMSEKQASGSEMEATERPQSRPSAKKRWACF